MTQLLRKAESGQSNTVMWTDEAEASFQRLKKALTEAPVLATPDFSKPFEVTVDASQVGIGGVLKQKGRVVAYESKKLSPAEQHYGTPDKELLAMVHCLKQWKVFLQCSPESVVMTDHKPNITWANKQDLSDRQIRWVEFLMQFPVKWQYLKGTEVQVKQAQIEEPPKLALPLTLLSQKLVR